MITVPEVVEKMVKESPFLEEGLAEDLINLSSLARQMQPEIQKKLYKDIQIGAIVMALKRLRPKLSDKKSALKPILENLGDLTVRSNIVEFTFENSSTLLQNQAKLLQAIADNRNVFLTITDGVFETSIFASQNLEGLIKKVFIQEKQKNYQTDLASITIMIPEEASFVPGVYYSILKKLAWEGINFVEVVSSYTELTIFMESKNVDRAFSVLKNNW